jgi:hypothetical protein
VSEHLSSLDCPMRLGCNLLQSVQGFGFWVRAVLLDNFWPHEPSLFLGTRLMSTEV